MVRRQPPVPVLVVQARPPPEDARVRAVYLDRFLAYVVLLPGPGPMQVASSKVGVRHEDAALRVAAPLRDDGRRDFVPRTIDAGRPRRPAVGPGDVGVGRIRQAAVPYG